MESVFAPATTWRTGDIAKPFVRSNEVGASLAEIYGASGAVVLASPLARRLYGKDVAAVRRTRIRRSSRFWPTWTLPPARSSSDARNRLDEALDAFALEHGIVDIPAEPRTRSSDKTRARILAFHNVRA